MDQKYKENLRQKSAKAFENILDEKESKEKQIIKILLRELS